MRPEYNSITIHSNEKTNRRVTFIRTTFIQFTWFDTLGNFYFRLKSFGFWFTQLDFVSSTFYVIFFYFPSLLLFAVNRTQTNVMTFDMIQTRWEYSDRTWIIKAKCFTLFCIFHFVYFSWWKIYNFYSNNNNEWTYGKWMR